MAFSFYEFFAGGGMAAIGLGRDWRCLFANDIDEKKAESYAANHDAAPFRCGDIHDLSADDLPGEVDLAWASFPCQDLSLAGACGGLNAPRSGAVWGFWSLIEALRREGRPPRIIALENVMGLIASHGGDDFALMARTFAANGYRFAPLVMDAASFTPQSRQRLFLVGLREDLTPPPSLTTTPDEALTPVSLINAVAALPALLTQNTLWFAPPPLAGRNCDLIDICLEGDDLGWRSDEETARLLAMMDERNRMKVDAAQRKGAPMVGAVYRRTRRGPDGAKVQRAEVRFDGLSGCLRTPGGGSSRQTLLFVDGDIIRSRLIAPREAARLMGLEDDYILPARYNDAYHLLGDGVCPPVVRYLAETLFVPALAGARRAAA